jgi:hypothetical protein
LGDQVADDTSIPDHVDHDAAVATSTLDVSASNGNQPVVEEPAAPEEPEPEELAPANDNEPVVELPATGTE